MGIEDEDSQDAMDELNRPKTDSTRKTDTLPARKAIIKKEPVNAVLPDKNKPKLKK